MAAAITEADAATIAAALRLGGTAHVGDYHVTAEELVLTETPREGWAVSSDAGATVALDLTVTPELRRAGLARDVVRLVQESRKTGGLDVSDRIEVWWEAEGEPAEALAEHGARVADEVLAVSFTRGRPTADVAPHADAELGLRWWLRQAGE